MVSCVRPFWGNHRSHPASCGDVDFDIMSFTSLPKVQWVDIQALNGDLRNSRHWNVVWHDLPMKLCSRHLGLITVETHAQSELTEVQEFPQSSLHSLDTTVTSTRNRDEPNYPVRIVIYF